MANYISSPSEPASSLQPPDGEGVKAEELQNVDDGEIPVDLAKRFFELQALNDRVKEENEKLGARNLVLEEMVREHRRLLEDKDEQVIRLKEEAVSMSGTEGRLKDKFERLSNKYRGIREAFESEERKWKEEAKRSEEKCWRLEVEKRKMEIDLLAVRRGVDGGGELVEKMKAVEELRCMLKKKEFTISEMERKFGALVKEKMKIEKELGDRVTNLEGLVGKLMASKAEKSLRMSMDTGMASNGQSKRDQELQNSVRKWAVGKAEKAVRMSPDTGMDSNVQSKRDQELQNSVEKRAVGKAEKTLRMPPDTGMVQRKRDEQLPNSASRSVGISLIEPKKETVEDDIQMRGHDPSKASFGSMVPDVGKEAPYTPKLPTTPIVEISDDEDEDEHEEQKKKQEEVKQSSSVALPSTPKRRGNFAFPKRKLEVVSCPVMDPVETKRCKNDGLEDGKLWESASKMFNAFTTNGELCMKSVCALYRKQEALGVWKNGTDDNNIFRPNAWDIAALGKCLTDGDPEGVMKKTLAEFERANPVGMDKCRDIARRHHKKLFEIYNNNMDPLFQP